MTWLEILVGIPFVVLTVVGLLIPMSAILAALRPKVAPATKHLVPYVSVIVPPPLQRRRGAGCLSRLDPELPLLEAGTHRRGRRVDR